MNNLSYELARKLKESGYPQEWNHCNGCDTCHGKDQKCAMNTVNTAVYYPTSDEIIEELGMQFDRLDKTTRQTGEREITSCFLAVGLLRKPATYAKEYGSTPLEALCNLYIAIKYTEN